MFDLVIVPLDGSIFAQRALAPAASIAAETGAELVAMTVVGDREWRPHHDYLERVCDSLGVKTRTPYVLAGKADECIADASEEPGALVVMTTHGSTGVRRVTLGSVAEGTIRRLRRPLVLIGPSYRRDLTFGDGTMMIALDGSRTAEAILPMATEWCAAIGMAAHPVSVTNAAGGDANRIEAASLTTHLRAVTAAFDRRGVTADWSLVHAHDAGQALVTYALGSPVNLVGMTTHGRTGLERVSMGSTAATLAHDLPCAMLVLRPGHIDHNND